MQRKYNTAKMELKSGFLNVWNFKYNYEDLLDSHENTAKYSPDTLHCGNTME